MSIEAATGIIALLLTVATTSLGMFVKNKVADSEDRVLAEIARNYMPRELAIEKFQALTARFDDFVRDPMPTPRQPRRRADEA